MLRRLAKQVGGVERDAPHRARPPPHQTVRADFPHTASRVGLVSSVSLPFAPRLRFTLIPMDAPPYGRAVSDTPPLTSSAKLVLAYTNLGLFNWIVDTIPSFCAELALEHFLVMGVLGVNNLL